MNSVRIDGNEFKQHIHRIDQLYAAPLGHRFLDGKHLGQPYGLLAVFLQLVAQIECRPFVGKNYGQFLSGEVVVALDVVCQLGDEGAFAHFNVY